MAYILVATEIATGEKFPFPMLVVDCDFDAHNGLGAFIFSNSPTKAKRFATAEEALTFYRTVSPSRPTRPDGEPNRPLTAFSVEVRRIEKLTFT